MRENSSKLLLVLGGEGSDPAIDYLLNRLPLGKSSTIIWDNEFSEKPLDQRLSISTNEGLEPRKKHIAARVNSQLADKLEQLGSEPPQAGRIYHACLADELTETMVAGLKMDFAKTVVSADHSFSMLNFDDLNSIFVHYTHIKNDGTSKALKPKKAKGAIDTSPLPVCFNYNADILAYELANSYRDNMITVLLGGRTDEGAVGAYAVKHFGGKVYLQIEQTKKFHTGLYGGLSLRDYMKEFSGFQTPRLSFYVEYIKGQERPYHAKLPLTFLKFSEPDYMGPLHQMVKALKDEIT